MADVRITVVKRMDNQELFGDNPPLTFTGVGLCDRFEDGQVFISKEGGYPEGFCPLGLCRHSAGSYPSASGRGLPVD